MKGPARHGATRPGGRMSRAGVIALALAAGCIAFFHLGRFIDTRGGVRWNQPLPEALTRDGAGRLPDVFPGDWEVLCTIGIAIGPLEREVRVGLSGVGLPAVYADNLPDVDMPPFQFAVALLVRSSRPRVLMLKRSRGVDFHFEGSACVRRAYGIYRVKMFETYRTNTPHAVITIDTDDGTY